MSSSGLRTGFVRITGVLHFPAPPRRSNDHYIQGHQSEAEPLLEVVCQSDRAPLEELGGRGPGRGPGAGCHLFGSLFSEKTKAAQQLKILITINVQVAVELNGGELLPLLEFIVDYSYN